MKTERRSFLKILAAVPVVGLLFDRAPRPMLESSRVEPKVVFPAASPEWGRVVTFPELKEVPRIPDGTFFFDLSSSTLYVWNAERAEWQNLSFRK